MKTADVIIRPILTEKSHTQMLKGVYTFLVNEKSSKPEVVKAVNEIFSVDVVEVNIAMVSPKMKRIGKTRKFASVGGGKKAIVKLKPGQTISALSPKTDAKLKKSKKSGGEKDVQKINVEGKEGA